MSNAKYEILNIQFRSDGENREKYLINDEPLRFQNYTAS